MVLEENPQLLILLTTNGANFIGRYGWAGGPKYKTNTMKSSSFMLTIHKNILRVNLYQVPVYMRHSQNTKPTVCKSSSFTLRIHKKFSEWTYIKSQYTYFRENHNLQNQHYTRVTFMLRIYEKILRMNLHQVPVYMRHS